MSKSLLRKRCRMRERRRAKRLGEPISEERIKECVTKELEKEKLRQSNLEADRKRLEAIKEEEGSIIDKDVLRRLSRINKGLKNPNFEAEEKEAVEKLLRDFEKKERERYES